MSFCIVCFFRARRLQLAHPTRPNHPGQQPEPPQVFSSSSDLTSELEDTRKFSLNSLTVLLAISGPNFILPVILTLLLYTISLRLAINTCFLRNYPALSRFLHVIPLIGTFCTAGVALVSGLQSPALATVGLLLGALPLAAMAIHHGRHCNEITTPGLPMQMQDLPLGISGTDGTTDVNGS